jgi:hypothetical protein
MKPAVPLTLDDEDEAVAEEENKIINEVCAHHDGLFVSVCYLRPGVWPKREIFAFVISNKTLVCSPTLVWRVLLSPYYGLQPGRTRADLYHHTLCRSIRFGM